MALKLTVMVMKWVQRVKEKGTREETCARQKRQNLQGDRG